MRSAAVFTTAPRPTWKWTEQLGLAYLEALACGLPIVTTRCGTNDEAVQPPNRPGGGRRRGPRGLPPALPA
uniref:Glycosyltransferase n=1 Tax=Janibacter limosus TaxID=53458 RepID=A0AC61U8M1_9MICO|nr:glycosyltransferase [Janibacter limosus]